MNNLNIVKRTVSLPSATGAAASAFTGSAADVVRQCTYPVVDKHGEDTGLTHFSACQLQVVAFAANNDVAVPLVGFSALFSNREYEGQLSTGAQLAQDITTAMLNGTYDVNNYDMVLSLHHGKTKAEVFSSREPYDNEPAPQPIADAFNAVAKPIAAPKNAAEYAAFLNVYAYDNTVGRPIKVADRAIHIKYAATVAKLEAACKAGATLQVVALPTKRLQAWLDQQNQPAESSLEDGFNA